LLGILAAIAATIDIGYRRIPNWLVLTGIVAGVAWNASVAGWPGFGRGLEGIGVGFILYFPLYLLRARGAGDVKLLAAVGAIAGPANCFSILLLTALLGGIIALILLLFRGRLRKTLFNVAWIIRELSHLRAPYASNDELDVTRSAGLRLPHATLIAVGVLAFIVMNRSGA
jgi:prepilin peptidase CpaA